MSKTSITVFAALLTASAFALGQAASQDQSLGAVAREQKAKKDQLKKKSGKLLTVADTAVSDTGRTDEPSEKGSTPAATGTSGAKPSAVFDNPVDSKVEPLVVPAGTEIRVDLVEGKVIVPVRVGFATPIPALSKIVVQVNRTYYPTGLLNDRVGYVGYADYATLTAITVGGVTYPVESDAIPVASPGSSAVTLNNTLGSSPHDATFVLSGPIAIER